MEEWKTYTLKDLSKGKGEYGIGAPAIPFNKDKYTYLRITDINDDGTLNYSGLMSVDSEDAEKYLLEKNDIVFARTGNSTGRSYFYDGRDGVLVYAGFLIRFRLDDQKVNPRILKYYTHSQPYYNWVKSFDTGGTRGNINAKTYGDMPLCLPPRPIQNRIVEILDALDDKIENNRRINDNLEQQAQALYKQWFVDNCNESWNKRKLSDFFNVITGKKDANYSTDNGEFPFFTCSQDILKAPNYSFDGAAILLAGNGDFNVKRYIGRFEAYQRTYVLIPFDQRYHSFLYLTIKYYLQEITGGSRGSVIKFITKGNIADFEISIPNDDISNKLEILDSLYANIDINTKENQNLAILRDTLLPRLMSGELSVNDVLVY